MSVLVLPNSNSSSNSTKLVSLSHPLPLVEQLFLPEPEAAIDPFTSSSAAAEDTSTILTPLSSVSASTSTAAAAAKNNGTTTSSAVLPLGESPPVTTTTNGEQQSEILAAAAAAAAAAAGAAKSTVVASAVAMPRQVLQVTPTIDFTVKEELGPWPTSPTTTVSLLSPLLYATSGGSSSSALGFDSAGGGANHCLDNLKEEGNGELNCLRPVAYSLSTEGMELTEATEELQLFSSSTSKPSAAAAVAAACASSNKTTTPPNAIALKLNKTSYITTRSHTVQFQTMNYNLQPPPENSEEVANTTQAQATAITSSSSQSSSSSPSEDPNASTTTTVIVSVEDPCPYKLYFRIYRAPAHTILLDTFQVTGLFRTRQENWNLIWGARLKEDLYSQINPFQKVNHFPGTWNIGRKDTLFRRLSALKRKLLTIAASNSVNSGLTTAMVSEMFRFLPQTFILPSDMQLLADAFKTAVDEDCCGDSLNVAFIIKPPAGACGKGIYLISKLEDLETVVTSEDDSDNDSSSGNDGGATANNSNSNSSSTTTTTNSGACMLAQRYIPNPLLINGFKFDLRLYVLVTCFDPLRIYIYEDGLVRFASQKYDFQASTLGNVFMHMTNYSINRKASGTTTTGPKKKGENAENDDNDDTQGCTKWSLRTFIQVLKHHHIDWTPIWESISEIVIKTMLSIESVVASKVAQLLKYRNCCFELFGIDILLDDKLQPYLLEVNPMPSLHTTTKLDHRLKSILVSDVFQMVGLEIYDREAYQEQQRR